MNEPTKAYIARFLDGDGSIMLQLVHRKDYKFGYQIRVSVCFYQKSKYRAELEKLKEILKFGYIRDRNDGMTEYTIVGKNEVKEVLEALQPYVLFKSKHVSAALRILNEMGDRRKMLKEEFLRLARLVDSYSSLNYSKKRKHFASNVEDFLNKRLNQPL